MSKRNMSAVFMDRRSFLAVSAATLSGLCLYGCTQGSSSASTGSSGSGSRAESAPSNELSEDAPSSSAAAVPDAPPDHAEDVGIFVEGTLYDRGYIADEVLQHPTLGDIHFSMHVPDEYDGSAPYALFVYIPGGGGWYTQGVGANLDNDILYVANNYVGDMIVICPQLTDWHETSADMVLALTTWALQSFNIDRSRVFLAGYSFGGSTLSLVMGKRPELYSRALQLTSRWIGNTSTIVEARTPLLIALGDADRYYSVSRAQETYDEIRAGYMEAGLSESEIEDLVAFDVKDAEFFDWSDDQHSVGADYFARDPETMGWLFA